MSKKQNPNINEIDHYKSLIDKRLISDQINLDEASIQSKSNSKSKKVIKNREIFY